MKNTESFWLGFIVGLVFVVVCAVGFNHAYPMKQIEVTPVSAPVDIQVYADLKELDKRDQQIAKRINEMQKQIEELYGRDEYLKSVLEQVINAMQGPTSRGGDQL